MSLNVLGKTAFSLEGQIENTSPSKLLTIGNPITEIIGGVPTEIGNVISITEAKDVALQFRNYLDVKDYGAVGDGITDDTIALRAVLLLAKTGDIKNIYFPTGIYMISGTLYIASNITIFGQGKELSIIKNLPAAETGLDLITPQDGAVTNPDIWTLRTMIATEGADYSINTRVTNIIIQDIGIDWNGVPGGINSIVPLMMGRADYSHIKRIKVFDALASDLEDVNEERQGLAVLFAFSQDCSIFDSWVGAADYESVSVRYLSKRIYVYYNDLISDKPNTYHWQTHLIQAARPTACIDSLEAQYGETTCKDIFVIGNKFHLKRNCLHGATEHTTEGFYVKDNYLKFYPGNVAWGIKSFESTKDVQIVNNIFDATEGGMNEFQQAVGNSVPRYGFNCVSLNQIQTTSNPVSNVLIDGNTILYKNTVAAITSPPAGGTSNVPLGYVNPFIGGFASNGNNVTISNNIIDIDGYDNYAKPILGIKGDGINVFGNTVRLSNPLSTVTTNGFKFMHIGGGKGINIDNNVVTGTSLGKGIVIDNVAFEDIKITPVNYNCTVVGDILTTGLTSQNEITVLPGTVNNTKADVNGNIVIDKASVGLGNVDNTSDADKPISIATAAVLATKPTADGTSSELIQGDGMKVGKSSVVRNTTIGALTLVNSALALTDPVSAAFGKAQGQIDAISKVSVNPTTSALSPANLNTTYPDVNVGHRVICKDIIGGGLIYTKVTEAGSSDIWVSTLCTIVV